ncbi:glutamine synthetase family protein [Compostimonas suwonensis]|uniref:Glutamine synthetase n=1 Tax=Compostimonas suwonensis TaxID=1048394 RepID=A0A2M9BUS4_9MICO|nr:glutamine synthetase family protein [Compostimonas suwonensis]PJJ61699.1 glutamine synthetase [Compostimonas suwonensis]
MTNPPSPNDLVIGSIVDMAGVMRAKVVPSSRLDSFVKSGMGASPTWTVFCVDDAIAFSPSFTVAGDLRLHIATEDLRDLGGGTRWAPARFTNQDGSPFPGCTRSALDRAVNRLASAGISALIGHEIEFTLFDATEPQLWAAYGLSSVLSTEGFLTDLLEAAQLAGVPIEQVHAEYGHNQFEIALGPAEPLRAADNMVLARIVISRTARKHGMRASFSPVPVAGGSGNGAHQHLSLTRDGAPLFSGGEGPYGLSDDGASAIAGLVTRLPEFMAALASSAVSALRLQPGMWSGAYCCWGLENREAAVRFCAATLGNPKGANVEVKAVDPSANPYLSSAAILGMAASGIEQGLALPPEVRVNPADLSEEERIASGAWLLPTTQPQMLSSIAGSELAREIFGDLVLEALIAVKQHEVDTFAHLPVEQTIERLRFRWSA